MIKRVKESIDRKLIQIEPYDGKIKEVNEKIAQMEEILKVRLCLEWKWCFPDARLQIAAR